MLKGRIELSPTVTIEVEAETGASPADGQKQIIETISFWQGIPSACPMPACGAPLIFTARHPQNFHYYGLRCQGVKPHEMNFGERKDGTSLYVKDDSWKDAYAGDGEQGSGPAPAQSKPAQTSPAGGQTPEAGISKETVANLMREAGKKGQNALEYAKALGYNVAGISGLTEAQGKDVVASLGML